MYYDAVSSTTATKLLAWSKATRDRLKSSRFMGALHCLSDGNDGATPRRRPHSIFWHIAEIGSISDGADVKCLEIVRQSDRKQR